jgi:hypothetical protein
MAIKPEQVKSKQAEDEAQARAEALQWARSVEHDVDAKLARNGWPSTVPFMASDLTPARRDALAGLYR